MGNEVKDLKKRKRTQTDKLHQEIDDLKTRNAALILALQDSEQEIKLLKDQLNNSLGFHLIDYQQTQKKCETLEFENKILKQKNKNLEQSLQHLKTLTVKQVHNARNAGRKPVLTADDIEKMREMHYKEGCSFRALAKEFGCSVGTIHKYCSQINK